METIDGGSFFGKLAALVGGALLIVASAGTALFIVGAVLSIGGGIEDLVKP